MNRVPSKDDSSLIDRWFNVISRQTEESSLAGQSTERLLASAKSWRAATDDSDAVGAIDTLRELDDATRWQVRRALLLALELERKPEPDPFPALVDALRAKDLRPLPKEPFPPFPQALYLLSSSALWSSEQAKCLAAIDSEQAKPSANTKTLDRELARLWQSGESQEGSDTLATMLGDWLMPTLAWINDDFATSVHIDPRFANFVPFVALGRERYAGSTSHTDSWRVTATTIANYHAEMRALYERFGQDARYALGGERLEALRQRLTLAAPQLAQQLEAKLHHQPLRVVMALMLAQLEARFAQLVKEGKTFDPAMPSINGLWPAEKLNEIKGYTNAAGFLRDLKHLHQSVGELYGGVAFAPEIRRVLMTCGGHGLRGYSSEINLSAALVSGDLSELAMRAGVLNAPLDDFEGEALQAAFAKLFAELPKLVEWANATALSASIKELFALLASVREEQRALDAEATTMFLLQDCVRGADALAMLVWLYLDDALDPKTSLGRPLRETISIVPEFGGGMRADKITEEFDVMLANEPFAAYLASRGGHCELALGNEYEASPYAKAWRDEASRVILVNHGKANEVVVTFCVRADEVESFPPQTLKSLVRIRENLHLDSSLQRPLLAEAKLRNTLATITRKIYLDEEAANAGAYRSLLRMLAEQGEAYANSAFKEIEEASDGKVGADEIGAWTRPWLGSANALMGFLDGQITFEDAPEVGPARLSLLQAAFIECPAFEEATRKISAWLNRNDQRVLALQAYRTLPKGTFGLVFPAIAPLLDEAMRGISLFNAPIAPKPASAIEDALWLVELAEH